MQWTMWTSTTKVGFNVDTDLIEVGNLCSCSGADIIMMLCDMTGSSNTTIAELEISLDIFRPKWQQRHNRVSTCLDMNPIGCLLCPIKSYCARTDQNPILISAMTIAFMRSTEPVVHWTLLYTEISDTVSMWQKWGSSTESPLSEISL
jgi:hypothetical protein